MQSPARQQGVALITAMLVVVLATIAAVAMVSRQQMDIRRTSNLLEQEQAMLYLYGIEGWVAHLLQRDKSDSDIDTLNENWAMVLPPIPVDGGQLTGKIDDLQGRFNLNNLVNNEGPVELQLVRFKRLLQVLELEPDLAMAVVDWLDEDADIRFPGGAEDGYYMGLEKPYRTGNGPMGSVSELRLVAGFDDEVYKIIEPYVTALPESATPLNVNTASAPVLRALADGITEGDAEALIELRDEEGFDTIDSFKTQETLAGREIIVDGLAVETNYFLVSSLIEIGRVKMSAYSMIQRSAKGVRTVFRGQGIY